MKNNKLTTKKVVQLTLLSCMLTAISACSSGNGSSSSGSNNNVNGDVSSLQIITPKTIYSKPGVAGSSYVVINNPTNTAVKNIQYSLSNQIGSGSGASVDPASAANCATVAAYSQCNIKVSVAAGAVAGSLGLNISNDSSLLSKLSKAAKAATPTPTMGIEQAAYNNLSGADGITLSYYHTVINGTPYILVSGLVASATAGTFNKIVLVNGSGSELPNQEVIGSINSSQGSTFNILLPVPSGSGASQTIKVQTQQLTNGQTTVVSTATSSSTLTTTQSVGIAEMLPSAVYLTESNPEQIITFLNTGDAVAQLQKLVSNNPNVEVVFNPASLGSGTTATATLKMKDKTIPATTGNVTLTYNNGQSETVTSGVVEQNINPTPSPSPGPTPTPPAPSPTPVAGLNAVFSPDNDFFKTSAGAPVSRQLTLTNTGNTDENAIVLTLPSGFTISNGTDPNTTCIVTQGTSPATISNTLTAGTGSCTVTVTYANNTVTPLGSENISIAYNYNSDTAAPIPTTAVVDHKVTQSTANLNISASPSPANYGSIANDGTATTSPITYTVTNSGEETATNLAFNFAGTDGALFHYNAPSPAPTGECSGSLSSVNGSNTCTISSSTTTFGPAANGTPVGTKTARFDIAYTPYTGGSTAYESINVSGNVTAAPSAAFSSLVTAYTFTGGTGTQGDPYTGYTGTAYTISVTYTNTSSIPATGFTTDYQNPPTNWTMTTHGCNGANMPTSTGTCTDIYTLSNAAPVGTTSINLANVTATWTDSSGTQPAQAIPGVGTVYANLTVNPTPPPAITIDPVANWETMMGSAYAFTATITNGSSTVTPTVSGITGNTVSPSSCALDSTGTASCVFVITDYTSSGNYSFWDPTNVANSTDVNAPSNASTNPGISLQVAADNNATINGNPSPQTFSNISGTVIAPYVYLSAAVPGDTATAGTGITWGTNGVVPTRFEAGSQSGGGTCSDSQKDNLTGLEWSKNAIIGFQSSSGGAPIDQPNYANTTANLNDLSWTDAATAIDKMNAATNKLCGQSDWRLPTQRELLSLFNYAAAGGSQQTWLNSQGFSNVQTNYYWSSTLGGSGAWYVVMNAGGSGSFFVSVNCYVWPVRGGQ